MRKSNLVVPAKERPRAANYIVSANADEGPLKVTLRIKYESFGTNVTDNTVMARKTV